jgi:NTP pyrophosphatase (non-canonical NTP hydrolase)
MSMTSAEYTSLALVTEFTPDFVRLEGQTPEHNFMVARALHAILGLMTEVGEAADMLKKHIIYGKQLDELNLLEEGGDITWYLSLLFVALRKSIEQAMEMNIAKLRLRYGAKFTAHAALNRDASAERQLMEETQKSE